MLPSPFGEQEYIPEGIVLTRYISVIMLFSTIGENSKNSEKIFGGGGLTPHLIASMVHTNHIEHDLSSPPKYPMW